MDKSLFERYLLEAPGDDAPADEPAPDTSGPPDMPDDTTPANDDPPDITDTDDDTPPPDMGGDDTTMEDDFSADDTTGEDDSGEDKKQKLGLDEKVSAIMNMNLYQRFITMLTKVTTQIGSMKANMDILHTISPDVIDIMESMNKLEENIRMYLKNSFSNENYSKNLLFFNKCLNLMKLLNDSFDSAIRKGVKDVK